MAVMANNCAGPLPEQEHNHGHSRERPHVLTCNYGADWQAPSSF